MSEIMTDTEKRQQAELDKIAKQPIEHEETAQQQKTSRTSDKGSPREKRPMEKSVLIVFLVILLILAAAAAGGIYCIWQITHIAKEGAGVMLMPGMPGI